MYGLGIVLGMLFVGVLIRALSCWIDGSPVVELPEWFRKTPIGKQLLSEGEAQAEQDRLATRKAAAAKILKADDIDRLELPPAIAERKKVNEERVRVEALLRQITQDCIVADVKVSNLARESMAIREMAHRAMVETSPVVLRKFKAEIEEARLKLRTMAPTKEDGGGFDMRTGIDNGAWRSNWNALQRRARYFVRLLREDIPALYSFMGSEAQLEAKIGKLRAGVPSLDVFDDAPAWPRAKSVRREGELATIGPPPVLTIAPPVEDDEATIGDDGP
jgi:hypothetical protein